MGDYCIYCDGVREAFWNVHRRSEPSIKHCNVFLNIACDIKIKSYICIVNDTTNN